jgi:hypothetical protein
MIWSLQGTPNQNALVQRALDACDFPFDRLAPGLRASVGRDRIPVVWDDLSRYGAQTAAAGVAPLVRHGVDDDPHDHAHGGDYDLLEFRQRVLGLAWYSGKISLDLSMETNPLLAMEVFLAEGAHMVDFFYMTEEERVGIARAFHGNTADHGPAHGHGWFDVGDYRSWIGEAFMGGFIKAFAPSVPVTIPFNHPATPAVGVDIRRILLREPVEPTPPPDVVTPPEEPSAPQTPVFATSTSIVFHDAHKGIRQARTWPSIPQAENAGLRACRVCKPR